jgi:hypothetical protein
MRSKRSYRIAAKKGAATRKANQRAHRRAARALADKHEKELRKIERLLGEEFDSLREARAALKVESELPPPSEVDITSADVYDKYYDDWDDGGIEFEDMGEIDAGVDY